MPFCKKCHEYEYQHKPCRCRQFTIVHDGEESQVFAIAAEHAAKAYAKEYNENHEYCLVNDEAEITVDGQAFEISAEPDVYYSVRKL